MVINPVECVDCGLCLPECPEEAILAENDLTDEQQHFKQLNEVLSGSWPVTLEVTEPLSNHEEWSGKENKLEHLVR
jgi:ferredoxin